MAYTIQLEKLKDPRPVYQSCMASTDPIFISADGREQMVLLNVSAYRQLYSRLQVYQSLERGEDDIAAGRFSDAFEMLDRVGAGCRV